jgi:D-serine deaminase-like pyridoxal phosphate-dependent protein
VELGAPGGRTGARDHATALEIAEAVVASPELALAGVSGYEGALAHHGDDGSLQIVRDYLESLAALHDALLAGGRYDERVRTLIVTAGGSAYFDVVAEVLTGRTRHEVMFEDPAPAAVTLHVRLAEAIRAGDATHAEELTREIAEGALQELDILAP